MASPTDFTSCNACSAGCISPTKHTCWRKDTDSESDEEPPPPKRQRTPDPQTSRTGGAHDGGQQFEIKMAAVIGLRGMEKGDNFELATNVTDAGNFDDLVYTAGGRRYFLQLKHTENPDTTFLQPKDLVELLHKCFESYYEMEDKDKSEFIIYTNKRLGPKLSWHKRNKTVVNTVESVFKTSTKGEIFNFIRDKNKKIDVYSGVETLVKKSKEFGAMSVPEQNYKVGMINEFLEKLIMVIGQKGQLKLDKVIYKEIKNRNEIKVGREVYGQVIRYFKVRLESWWRNKNETMTPETLGNWLQEAKTKVCASVVRSLYKGCTKTLVDTGMKFSDSEVSRFQAELSDKRAVHLRSDALTLCSILLLDCLNTSKCIFVTLESLKSNKNMLLHAWLGGYWEWLIVFCDSAVQQSDISGTCLEISEIIKSAPSSKRVVILTACKVQQVDFVPTGHEFKFGQLSKETQEIVLDKTIDFQGCKVTMRSVLQRHNNVEHVLGPELVTDLVTDGTTVNIGGTMQVNEGYYAPRVLKKNIVLHSNVLQDTNDVFAVSGTTMEYLRKIVPSGKAVECVSREKINSSDFTQDIRDKILLLSDQNAKSFFLSICEKLEGKTLHWVEFKEGDLLWKKSQGDIDSLLNYIDADKTRGDERTIREFMKHGNCKVNEEAIWDLGERTVLVVADPGMGKSSTTTQVAWNTKSSDPTRWVLRINWNDHSRKLKDINAAAFNFDSLAEFLCSAAFPESKYTDIERILFKQALKDGGNVRVLMDGFDEISPLHANKAAVILSELMKTKVERVWVTSRPVQKDRLEKELRVTAFSLKGLSRSSQIRMLSNLWELKPGTNKFALGALLVRVNHSIDNTNFTGCPLYITMIATIYEKDRETLLNSRGWLRRQIDIGNMYEVFVDKKLFIYLTEKQKADETNSGILDDYEDLKRIYFENFEKCALVAILPPNVLESLHNKKIEEEIQPFLVKVQAGKDKRGIVMNVVDGKPQFVHRTFTEFFTARWFSRNFKFNRSVLKDILFDFTYRLMTVMFDRMLARDCPLHYALIDGNNETVKTLLAEGCDFNAEDEGGRTFMHIIATRDSACWDEIKQKVNYKAFLKNTDSVLQWTPLQYAIKSEHWSIVERLLESNVDRSELDMIRQRAQDPDYIAVTILDAVRYGHLLLLEFLCSIGVNIHVEICRGLPSPLHAAIQLKELTVVKWLIQHGADCNTQYSNGQTPLFLAVAMPSLDVVRALVEEGGASLDIRDDKGRTVTDWAKGFASLPKNQNMGDIKEIVKYLEERSKVSSSVWQNINT